MPRNGSGVYSLPVANVVSGNTISSSHFNSLVNDLESDANTDRPVSAGGTGASNASGARTNLELGGKWKLDATASPTVNDDSDDGYDIGSIWIDISNDAAFTCVDATVGAAVWLVQGGGLSDGSITLAKLADMSQDRVLGRVSSGSGVPEELTAAQLRTLLNVSDGAEANADIASQAEAEAGTDNTDTMTALRVAQAIAAQVSGGGMQSVQAFTASGTWTRPSGITKILIFATGGGAGGGTYSGYGGGGGGAGATAIRFLDVSSISSAAVTIGAGGAGNSAGSSTTFGSYATGGGGSAGGVGNTTNSGAGGSGGSASSGDLNVPGGTGDSGGAPEDTSHNGKGGHGGASFWGSGGSGGIGTNANPSGGTASAYGGGGGSGAFAGSGASGVVFVMEFA